MYLIESMSTPKPRYMKTRKNKSINTRSKKIGTESDLATSIKENLNLEFTKSDETSIAEKDSSQDESSMTETETESDDSASDASILDATRRRRGSAGSMDRKKLKSSNIIEDCESKHIQSLQNNKEELSKNFEKEVSQEIIPKTPRTKKEKSELSKKEAIKKASLDESEPSQSKKQTAKTKGTSKKSEKPVKTTRQLKTSISIPEKDEQPKTKETENTNLEEQEKDDKNMILEKLQELNRPTNITEFTSIIKNSIKKTQLVSLIEKMGEEGLINTKLIMKKILMFSCKDEILDEQTNEAFLIEIEKIKEEIATEKAHLNQLKLELQSLGTLMTTNEIQERIDSVSNKIEILNKTIEERNKEKVVDKSVFEKETERMQVIEKQLKTRIKLYKNIKSVLEEGFGKSWKEIALEIGIEEE